MKKALITGITGQDGSYLATDLFALTFDVILYEIDRRK
jgi:GDP-D-mannose dehydratase